jgi:hypothetical protein
MKALIISSVLLSTTAFAQSIDLNTFKSMLTQRKAVLETVYPGMTKKTVTVAKYPTETGFCDVTETAVQTILKIENSKIIIHSKESYSPARTSFCAGFEFQEGSVLFYEDKPSLAQDLADLDASASQITSINVAGNIVTMSLAASSAEAVTVKYDLTKPTFKNLIYTKDSTQTVEGSDMADVSVESISLKNILFCESAESNDCSQGDWSDILF